MFSHAYALIADGVESLLDDGQFSSLSGWAAVCDPPDQEHTHGHGKGNHRQDGGGPHRHRGGGGTTAFERAGAEGGGTANFVLRTAVLVAVVIKEILFRRVSEGGRRGGQHGAQDRAWHQRSDAITSLAGFVGIAIALMSGYPAADKWAAALAACGIIATNSCYCWCPRSVRLWT